MKRVLLITCIAGTFLTSCNTNTFSNIDSGVRVVTKCGREISVLGSKGCKFIESNEKISEENTNSKGLLPTYSWDAKQMLW